ncbi:DUF1749-domain-containing protein [Bimuria novae-zelandiae CBS 107.79]|uniref:DUF1749-domain-containing protein n=1 Tax=Bimuria novae-zelandiae CBS 107.79 TaxID=1447943 RepID=A0A6A5VHE7_9PLEO|nr:DUF1749-domain-containing protein [Bimuria novae-zelandiae CBS 107.79]
MASAGSFPVIVHQVSSNLVGYERAVQPAKNALIFIGGLTEGPHTDLTANVIAQKLQNTTESFSVWELRMRSSYSGFGYSSLSNDVEDISALVAYLRTLGKEKIVLCGISTGCQDCLEYTDHKTHNSTPVDGYILLSPVSDRETAILLTSPEDLKRSIQHAQQMITDGKKDDAMPNSLIPPIFDSPITAYRWNSLAAKGGDDDYFSSDLDDATVKAKFSRVDRPILMLPGDEDELVPPYVNRKEMLDRWIRACPQGTVSKLSGFVPKGDHTISGPEAQEYVGNLIVQFVQAL